MSNTTVASNIQTMKQFADACHSLSSNEIYELFDNGISDELRDEIYQTFWSNSPEPARAALRQLGYRYSSIGLMDY